MLTKEQALKLLKDDMHGTAEALISLAMAKGVDPETLYQGYIDDIVETASILEEEADVDYAHKVWVESVNKLASTSSPLGQSKSPLLYYFGKKGGE